MVTEETKSRETAYFFLQVYLPQDEICTGKIYSPLRADEIEFRGLDNVILLMDQIMDQADFPQKSMRQRTFLLKETPKEEVNLNENRYLHWDEILKVEERKKVYFSIYIIYRQNLSWQGRIQWRKETKMFRSVLELLYLIKEALDLEMENGARVD